MTCFSCQTQMPQITVSAVTSRCYLSGFIERLRRERVRPTLFVVAPYYTCHPCAYERDCLPDMLLFAKGFSAACIHISTSSPSCYYSWIRVIAFYETYFSPSQFLTFLVAHGLYWIVSGRVKVHMCKSAQLGPCQLSFLWMRTTADSRTFFFHFSNVFKTKKLQKQHISINKFQQKHLKTAAMNILCRCRNQSCVYFSLFFLYGAFCTSTYGMKMSGLFCIFWQDLYRLLSALYTLAKVEDVHYS